MTMTRKNFMGGSAVLAAGMMGSGRVFGANEKIGVCVIGVHGRGKSHISGFTESPDSEVVALCDPDRKVLADRAGQLKAKTGKMPKTYTDIRDALTDGAIDAVSIATPNHWHALGAVWAAEAGKDVYVEKPAAHTVEEGQQLLAAEKQYGRIMMHGTQSRSSRTWMRDMPLLQSGEIIGPLHSARALGYKNGNRGSLGFSSEGAPPEHLDWRLWQGPASEQPYNPVYVHYNWHWFWHYGNGEIGNQGVHQMDLAVWGINKGLPVNVYSGGGRYTYVDQGETPNTNTSIFKYADGTTMVFDVRNRWTNGEGGVMSGDQYKKGVNVGNLFYGSEGYYVQGQGFFDTKNKPITLSSSDYPTPESDGHFQNFLNAVKTRDKKLIQGTMKAAHEACVHIHVANISYRLGRSLEFDPAAERFVNDTEANAMLGREYHPDFKFPALT